MVAAMSRFHPYPVSLPHENPAIMFTADTPSRTELQAKVRLRKVQQARRWNKSGIAQLTLCGS
jgi:hypothetical protein